jgi:hypothetical protein
MTGLRMHAALNSEFSSVPGDVPPTTYGMTWDGRQVLEYIDESDHPYWTLYQAPAEHRDDGRPRIPPVRKLLH